MVTLLDDDWDDYADDWDGNQGVIIYANHTFETLKTEIELEGVNIFDFGCGTGNLTEKMAKLAIKVVALDTSPKMISILEAKKIHNATALQFELSSKEIMENNFFNDKFDLITASSVMAFVLDFDATLKHLKTLLTTGGTFIQWDWFADEEGGDVGFSKKYLETAYANAGFKSIKITQPFSLKKESGDMKVVMAVAKSV